MKRMFARIGSSTVRRCVLTLSWCLVATAILTGEPGVGRADTSEKAKATEQLFEAVHANDFAAVQASVAAGADVEAADRWGMTPMELAIDKGYFEIGHYLVAVRNFSRSNADKRPAAPVMTGSPFAAITSDGENSGNSGEMSPLGPLTKSVDSGRSGSSSPTDVDIETSAGPAGNQAISTVKHNPFDPNAPAYGSGAFSVGEIGGGASDALSAFATRNVPPDGENTAVDASAAIGRASESAPDGSADGAQGSGFSNRVIGVGGESQ